MFGDLIEPISRHLSARFGPVPVPDWIHNGGADVNDVIRSVIEERMILLENGRLDGVVERHRITVVVEVRFRDSSSSLVEC